MKSFKQKKCCAPGWDLKVLAVIGGAIIALMFCVPFVFGFLNARHQTAIKQAAYNQPLGQEGSGCGGTDRLPCGPGLRCSTSSIQELGKCVKDENKIQRAATYSAVGKACDASRELCAPGSYCKRNNDTSAHWGTCSRFDVEAPFISSVRIENMQLDMSGVYRGAVDTKAKITVQAVNASSVSMALEKPNTCLDCFGETQTLSGGLFVNSFDIKQGLSDNLVIKATGKNGDVSVVIIAVASAE